MLKTLVLRFRNTFSCAMALVDDAFATAPKNAPNVYAFRAFDSDGKLVSLGDMCRGHVTIIVNVACECGLTNSNYKQLVQLHDRYAEDKGLRILAFPCNQFGGQEPGSAEDIKEFVKKFNVNFPMFAKIDVNGSKEHPLFTYLKAKQGGTLIDALKWNFTKFVINKEGVPVARFGPTDEPIPKVEEKIKTLF